MSRAGNYQFQSQPRAVESAGTRRKYRDPTIQERPPRRHNLMNDRRVIRGNTHAVIVSNPLDSFRHQADKPKQNASAARRRRLRQETDPVEEIPQQPVDEGYEELPFDSDQEIVDYEAYEDKVPEPVFVPKPAGVAAATHMDEGDLFDFEMAVEPVLEVLVGKCMDQSIAEVLEEREIQYLQQQATNFDIMRTIAFASAEALKAECVRRNEEKHRRTRQERDRMIRERVTAHKVSSRESTADYLAHLQAQVMEKLDDRGTFYDPVTLQVQNLFLPWLLVKVSGQLEVVGRARQEMDTLIQTALDKGITQREAEIKLQEHLAGAAERKKKAFEARVTEIKQAQQKREEEDVAFEQAVVDWKEAEEERRRIEAIPEDDSTMKSEADGSTVVTNDEDS